MLHRPSVVAADDNPVVGINGNRYLPFTTPEFVEAFSQLETRKDDVFIATWPKSGKCNGVTLELITKVSQSSRCPLERAPYI